MTIAEYKPSLLTIIKNNAIMHIVPIGIQEINKKEC